MKRLPAIILVIFFTVLLTIQVAAVRAQTGDEPVTGPITSPITSPLTPSEIPSVSPSETPTPTLTEIPTSTITETPTPTMSETPTPTMSETPTPTMTLTPTSSPSPTPTITPSETPTMTPMVTPTPPVTGNTVITGHVILHQLNFFGPSKNTPAQGVKVTASFFFDNSKNESTTTDANGMYTLSITTPGLYELQAETNNNNTFFVPVLNVVNINMHDRTANFEGIVFANF